MSGRIHPLSIALLTGLSILLAFYVFNRPAAHWDVIAYVASALKSQGLNGVVLHERTYEIIRDAYDPTTFETLIGAPGTGHGGYRYTVYSDPESLEQQLPFYRIRVAYIAALNALAPLTGSLVTAAQLVSAACAGIICLVTGLLLLRGPKPMPPWAAFLVLPLIVAGTGTVIGGRMETPDLLASCMALLVLAFWSVNRAVALCILVLLPLVRTDAVLLAGLLLFVLWFEKERRWYVYIPIFCAFGAYLLVTHLYGQYGHLVLFNFTLLNGGPDPYPARMEIATDIGLYLKFYVFAVIKFAPSLLFLAVILLVVAAEIRRTGRPAAFTAMAIVSVLFVTLHFLLFPLGSARHYVFAMTFAAVYAVKTLFGWAVPPPQTAMRRGGRARSQTVIAADRSSGRQRRS